MPHPPPLRGASGAWNRNGPASLPLLPLIAFLLLLTACDSGTAPTGDPPPGGDPPPSTATYFVGVPGLGQRADVQIALYDVVDGAIDPNSPVEDAEMTLNGVDLAYDASLERYAATLPAVPAPGDAIALTIRIGDQLIEGTATMPQAPSFTAPLPDANFAVDAPIELEWELEGDVARYQLHLKHQGLWIPHPIEDGSVRSYVLPAALYGALPQDATPIVYQMDAHANGSFSGPAHPESVLGVVSSTTMDRSFSIGTSPPSYYVEGSDMGPRVQWISVLKVDSSVPGPSEPVLDLTGTVNGVDLSYDAANGKYRAELPTPLGAGGRLDLSLTGTLGTVQATGFLPDRPLITAPEPNSDLPATSPLVVTWESDSDPDAFQIFVQGDLDGAWSEPIPGDARSYTFAAADLPGTGYLGISLYALDHGLFTSGPFSPSSTMRIRHEATNNVIIRRVIVIPDFPLP